MNSLRAVIVVAFGLGLTSLESRAADGCLPPVGRGEALSAPDERADTYELDDAASIAVGNTLYVDDDASAGGDGRDWSTAFRYLQDAIAASTNGTTILIAGGTYRPHMMENGAAPFPSFQLPSELALSGGYAGLADPDAPDFRDTVQHQAILSGDINEDDADGFANIDDNSVHVVRIVVGEGGQQPVILDGLTITGGNAVAASAGGGLEVAGSSVVVTNCIFIANHGILGSGMGAFGNATVANSLFIENSAHARGGGAVVFGTARFENCTFTENTAEQLGGAVAGAPNSSITASDCIFWGNRAVNATGVDAQVVMDPAGEIEVVFSCIQDNIPGDGTVPFGGLAAGNVDDAPRFVPGPAGCFYLSQIEAGQFTDSPCVDSGSGGAPSLGFTDSTSRS